MQWGSGGAKILPTGVVDVALGNNGSALNKVGSVLSKDVCA
jgi:hypothetical protein